MHDHTHPHRRASDDRRRRVLWWVLAANGAFLVVEVIGGLAFGSLALLADGVHMASDVGGLGIALAALSLAARPASARHTYGLRRAEVLGAQLNAVLLLAAAGWIAMEAWGRVGEERSVDGAAVLVVAAAGLAVNLASARVLSRTAGANINMRAAMWHMASDALGSVAALVAGAAALWWDATDVDLVASVVVAFLVAVAACTLLRDATRVLLESTPSGVALDAVVAAIGRDPDVEAVHHVHIWSLGSESAALSAHVVLRGPQDLHAAQGIASRIKAALATEFAIEHVTLETECHDCETVPADHLS
ncbi:MAG: cation diffusion facilitator family transporter [Actinomycetota bacterium]